MQDAYIFDALRTPRAKGMPARKDKTGGKDKPGGAFCDTPPHELIGQIISGLLERNGEHIAGHIARLNLGCVGQVGAQGGHIALVSRLMSPLPDEVAVKTLNNYCVSGLTAIGDGVLATQAGQSGLTLAGGVESLSQVGFLADKASYYLDPALSKASRWAPPIMGAELIATIEGFTQNDLDEISFSSQQKASAAWAAGHYENSVLPIKDPQGNILLAQDELVRPSTTMDSLAALTPAFAKQGEKGFDAMMLEAFPKLAKIDHVHSFGHCPGMADGAALVLLGSKQAGDAAGLKPKARIIAYAERSADPILQFTAGFKAMEDVLQQAGLSLDDLDLIEFMEAFAAVPLKFMRDYNPDPAKVNVNGGHLAMGHPMGATGAILMTTLVHELERRDVSKGIVIAHAGGGIGAAMIIERV